MKLLLCMVVIGASLAVGLWLSMRLSERTKLLGSYITLLQEVALKMTYTSDSLAKLFADNFAGYPFTDKKPFAEQFTEMTRRYQGILSAEDCGILEDFSRGLGDSDTGTQLKHIQLYTGLLTGQRNKAQQAAEEKGRLYRILPRESPPQFY